MTPEQKRALLILARPCPEQAWELFETLERQRLDPMRDWLDASEQPPEARFAMGGMVTIAYCPHHWPSDAYEVHLDYHRQYRIHTCRRCGRVLSGYTLKIKTIQRFIHDSHWSSALMHRQELSTLQVMRASLEDLWAHEDRWKEEQLDLWIDFLNLIGRLRPGLYPAGVS